jgi:hypothetical protein
MKEIHEMTFQEFKQFISSQADNTKQNSVSVDDYSKDGMTEYFYPKEFIVNGDQYRWSLGKRHTKGRSLQTHYELWGHSETIGSYKIATGTLTKGKLFKFFKDIHKYYITAAMQKGYSVPSRNLKQYKLSA